MSPQTPFGNVSGFRRDIIVVLAATDGANGQELVGNLQHAYGEQITNSRFYSGAEELVERGWVEKRKRNGRSNEYRLTEAGEEALQTDTEWRTKSLE